jgi:hypothetical protein
MYGNVFGSNGGGGGGKKKSSKQKFAERQVCSFVGEGKGQGANM